MKDILKQVPWTEILDLVDTLHEGGLSDADIAKQISEFLDEVLDFNIIVKGTAGHILEQIDGPILLAAISVIIKLSKSGKEKRKQNREMKFKSLKLSKTIHHPIMSALKDNIRK